MVVCLCTGLSERDIERVLENGAGSLSEIGDSCGAGLDCGGCRSTLREILDRRSCEGCPNRPGLQPVHLDSVAAIDWFSERSPL